MKVIINRNYCGHHPSSCERCFGELLRHEKVSDWACITDVQEDDRPEIHVEITSGPYRGSLVVTEENREEIMVNGYIKYADLPPEAFDIVPPHGDDVRRMLREQEAAKKNI